VTGRSRTTIDRRQSGQVLVMFAIALTAILIALALLFDGGQTLVLRRQLQNSADSGALAGANIVQNGKCTAARVSKTATDGSNDIYLAVRAKIVQNMGWTTARADAALTVTCATDQSWYNGYAVAVALSDSSPTYFGAMAGTKNIRVSVTSTAFNGPVSGGKFSVTMLDPCNNGSAGCAANNGGSFAIWPNGFQGCPALSLGGNSTVVFEGSVQSDSACLAGAGGSFAVTGGSATITLQNGAQGQAYIRMVGSWAPGTNTVNPAPLQFQPKITDPLSALPAISTAGWLSCPSNDWRCPNNGGSTTTIGNGSNARCWILSPGVYNGGISIQGQGTAYLLPGIYVMLGGGLTFGGQGSLYALKQSLHPSQSPNAEKPDVKCTGLDPVNNWGDLSSGSGTLCPIPTSAAPGDACGVLVYNRCSGTPSTCSTSGSDQMGPVNLTGGSGIKLRAFCTNTDTTPAQTCPTPFAPAEQETSNTLISRYRNLLFWQDAQPVPTNTNNPANQKLRLRGGGALFVAGTVYAPSAQVDFGGNCSGNGGSPLDLTLQFISWDLFISGSCSYNFLYRANSFATPTSYGLVR